jgi:nucleoid-associated protein YgaU
LGLVFIYIGVKDIAKDTTTDNTQTDNTEGSIGIGVSITKDQDKQEPSAETSASAHEKSLQTQQKIKEDGKWIATDYIEGDIGKGQYIVKEGDTLWEIAEAVYGSGFEWSKILEKNKSMIGFLPNGSQALIWPGQVLTIE